MTAPILLLHPLGADHTFWAPLLPLLEGREVIALDLPGHGAGPELRAGATVDDLTAGVIDELDARHVGSCDVVGISLGGLVAQRLATTRSERVARLVLMDTVAVYTDGMRRMWTDRAALARDQGTGALVPATLEVWFTTEFVAAAGPDVRRAVAVLERTPAEAYARTCELLREVDLSWEADLIRQPTLVACGEGDGEPFVASARAFAGAIPGARLVWLPGKHAAVLEQPAVFADALLAFLDDTETVPVTEPAGDAR